MVQLDGLASHSLASHKGSSRGTCLANTEAWGSRGGSGELEGEGLVQPPTCSTSLGGHAGQLRSHSPNRPCFFLMRQGFDLKKFLCQVANKYLTCKILGAVQASNENPKLPHQKWPFRCLWLAVQLGPHEPSTPLNTAKKKCKKSKKNGPAKAPVGGGMGTVSFWGCLGFGSRRSDPQQHPRFHLPVPHPQMAI